MSKIISDSPLRRMTPAQLGYTGKSAATNPALSAQPQLATGLLGLNSDIYEQIQGAIAAGKTHLMFFGPPGTGKTTLAREVGQWLLRCAGSSLEPELITASADWSSQDLVGGYQPIGGGEIGFRPGILLRRFDRPIIIDEFNRCDIDKVLGPLFSMLVGQNTTLPYFADPVNPKSENITILAAKSGLNGPVEYSPTPDWRILGTLNTSDKATLAIMSFALMRRFAWIFVDVPADKAAFIREWCAKQGWALGFPLAQPPLANIWEVICTVRPLGAAPFVDVLNFCRHELETFDPSARVVAESVTAYVNALCIFVIQLLDGIERNDATIIRDALVRELNIAEEDEVAVKLTARLNDVAV